MPASRLVDTNVLIVASAADAGSPFRPEGTPVDDAALRQRVFDWLEAFEADPARHAVLDAGWQVCGEYDNRLRYSSSFRNLLRPLLSPYSALFF